MYSEKYPAIYESQGLQIKTEDGHNESLPRLICWENSAVLVWIWQLDCFVPAVSTNDKANTFVIILFGDLEL